MKKFLLLLGTFLIASCKSAEVREDLRIGEMDAIIENLGSNCKIDSYIVNADYKFSSEIEPSYFDYFSEEEKKSDVRVFAYYWKKGRRKIIVWAKENNGRMEAFSSVEYFGNVVF